MLKLRVLARLTRLMLVLLLGLLMASVIALGERVGLTASIERRQRWSCWFMKRLVAALPFEVRVLLGNLLAGHPTVKKFLLLFFNILNVIIIPHTLWLCEHRT